MAGLYDVMESGKQGMLVSQASIQVTGRNIANMNTLGYSRQRLDVTPILPEILAGFSLGAAISGETLVRLREDFTDRQFWNQNSLRWQYDTEESLLQQLEGILPVDTETGLRSMLDEFWGSWNNLANDPESSVARTSVLNKAETLVLTFNRVHLELASFQSSIGTEIDARLDEINLIAAELAKINAVNPGDNLELEDQRVRLIDKLSRLAPIQVIRSGKSISVTIGGISVVSATNSIPLEASFELDSQGIGVATIKVAGTNLEVKIATGELGGLLNVYSKDIPDTLDNLNTLAATLATEVNALHATGFDLNNNTGINFFASTSDGAATIAVESAIRADSSLIASSDATNEPGNGSLAQAISDLSAAATIGDQSIGEFQRTMVASLGTRIQETRFLRSSQQSVVNHLALKRESVAGVSIEEEMTRLVQLEQSFATASRLVRVADELIRTLLQLI